MTTMIKSNETNLENHQFMISLKADPASQEKRDIYNGRLNNTNEAAKGYREVTTEFTTSEEENNPLFIMQTFSEAYISSIKLEKISETEPEKSEESKNLIKNGDFSDGLNHWNAPVLSVIRLYMDDRNSLILPYSAYYKAELEKPIEVEPNTTYELSFDAQTLREGYSAYNNPSISVGYSADRKSSSIKSSSLGEWERSSLKYTTGSNQTLLNISISTSYRNAKAAITNIELKKIN